jgi:hypothetical protein
VSENVLLAELASALLTSLVTPILDVNVWEALRTRMKRVRTATAIAIRYSVDSMHSVIAEHPPNGCFNRWTLEAVNKTHTWKDHNKYSPVT